MAAPPLTYAIGDIHGCADVLDALLAAIEADAAGRARSLVFLGDYIDRGPESARVIETLSKLQWREPERVTCLMGNHEAMLLMSLREPGALDQWIANGGAQTLEDFGVTGPEELPGHVLDWIEGLPSLHEDALRWYVHAGFRPGTRPPESDDETRLWIRNSFLTDDYDFGRHVIHGHTPQESARPECRPFRTNIDTGAVYGGALTAAVLTDAQAAPVAFLRVRPD